MIVFNLECQNCKQNFEGWFDSQKEFNSQLKRNLIKCPTCDSQEIKKGLVAPNLSKKSNSKNKTKKSIATNISKLKKMVEENFDYVGEKFTEEAKKIKYGETQDRPIYGEASMEQTKDLINEEIDIVPLPFSSKKTN